MSTCSSTTGICTSIGAAAHAALLAAVIALCACEAKGKGDKMPVPATVSSSAVGDTIQPTATPPGAVVETSKPAPAEPDRRAYTGEISAPSDLDIIFIFYDHSGQTPPFDDWAANAQEVRYADEFKRPTAKAHLEKKLRDHFESVRGTGKLVVAINSVLSQYASDYQEFYISAFEPGSHLSFGAYGAQIKLEFSNAQDAYRWKLPPDKAAQVFEKNGESRSVILTIELRIDNARPRGSGGVLRATVLRYTVDGIFNKGRLGDVQVAEL